MIPSTPYPTPGLWHALQEATAEAARRGHSHVGAEHFLHVLASRPDGWGYSMFERWGTPDEMARGLDELMGSAEYGKARSNEVWEDGKLVGYMVVGPDGKPRIERIES